MRILAEVSYGIEVMDHLRQYSVGEIGQLLDKFWWHLFYVSEPFGKFRGGLRSGFGFLSSIALKYPRASS